MKTICIGIICGEIRKSNIIMNHVKKPDWLKINIGANARYTETKHIVDSHKLHTICSSGTMSQYGRMLGKRYCHFYDRWRNLYPFLQILQHTDRTASSVRP